MNDGRRIGMKELGASDDTLQQFQAATPRQPRLLYKQLAERAHAALHDNRPRRRKHSEKLQDVWMSQAPQQGSLRKQPCLALIITGIMRRRHPELYCDVSALPPRGDDCTKSASPPPTPRPAPRLPTKAAADAPAPQSCWCQQRQQATTAVLLEARKA